MKKNHLHPSAKSLAISLVAAAALAVVNSAQAVLIFTLTETGSGVTLVGSGSFNFGPTLPPLIGTSGVFGSTLVPGTPAAIAWVGPVIPADGFNVTHLRADQAIVPGGPDSFGSFTESPSATSSSGDTFGISAGARHVELPLGYTSGTALNGETFWSGATLASLGATPGTYQWNTSYGGVNDSITLNVSSSVPEAGGTVLFMLIGLTGMVLVRRRMA